MVGRSILYGSTAHPYIKHTTSTHLSKSQCYLVHRVIGHSTNYRSLLLRINRRATLRPFKFLRIDIQRVNNRIYITLTRILREGASNSTSRIDPTVGVVRRLIRVRNMVLSVNNSTPRPIFSRYTISIIQRTGLGSATFVILLLKPQVKRRHPCLDRDTKLNSLGRFEHISLYRSSIKRPLLTHRRRHINRTKIMGFRHRRIHFKINHHYNSRVLTLTNTSFRGRQIIITPVLYSRVTIRHRTFTCIRRVTDNSVRRVHINVIIPYTLRTIIGPSKTSRGKRRFIR